MFLFTAASVFYHSYQQAVSLVDMNESIDVCDVTELWAACWEHALMFMDEVLGMSWRASVLKGHWRSARKDDFIPITIIVTSVILILSGFVVQLLLNSSYPHSWHQNSRNTSNSCTVMTQTQCFCSEWEFWVSVHRRMTFTCVIS